MRRVILLALVLGALTGCRWADLFYGDPPCPKRIAVDTLAWVVIVRDSVRSDSIPMVGNEREVCAKPNRFIAR